MGITGSFIKCEYCISPKQPKETVQEIFEDIFTSKYDEYFNSIEYNNFLSSHNLLVCVEHLISFSINKDTNTETLQSINKDSLFLNKRIDSNFIKNYFLSLTAKPSEIYEDKNCLSSNNTDDNKETFFIYFIIKQIEVLQHLHQFNYNVITKRNMLPFLLHYCSSFNIDKISLLFNCFKNHSNLIEKSSQFKDFILQLIIISSIGLYKTAIYFNRITLDSNSAQMSKCYSYESITKCANYVINTIFPYDHSKLTLKQFINQFDSQFLFIFYPNGIRAYLEKNC